MATIGTFSQKDGKWTGTIRTMTINVKAQMVPVTEKAEGGPDYRIFAGGAELGAAWREESKDGETPYLAVKLDDPGFESRCGPPSSRRRRMAAACSSGTGRS